MEKIVLIVHVVAAAIVIGLVLLQHGKGAEMGASFGGGGGSNSLFGVSGSANLLSRLTALFVMVFFCTSLLLAYLASHQSDGSVISSQLPVQQVEEVVPESSTEDIPK